MVSTEGTGLTFTLEHHEHSVAVGQRPRQPGLCTIGDRSRIDRSPWSSNSRGSTGSRFDNDPVTDTTAEALFIRDEEQGIVWVPTPSPLPREHDDAFEVCHSAGRTTIDRDAHGIVSRVGCPSTPPIR